MTVRDRIRNAEWLPQASAIALLTFAVAALWATTYAAIARKQDVQEQIITSHAVVLGEYGQRISGSERRLQSLEELRQDVRENNALLREFIDAQKKRTR